MKSRTKPTLRGFLVAARLPIVVVVLAVIGLSTGDYYQQLLLSLAVYALFALGLYLIMHYLGEVSFGHGLYLGLGAYLYAIVSTDLHADFWTSILLSVVGCTLFGFLTGLIGARLHRIPFAMLTFALSGILLLVAQNAISLTNGEVGMTLVSPDYIGTTQLAILGVLLLIVALVLLGRFQRSRLGLTLRAIRDNEPLAETLGLKPWPFRLAVLTAAALLGGVAGVLYGINLASITPESFGSYYSGIAILMVVVGGRSGPGGSLIGALFFVAVPELLRTTSATLQIIIFAVVLIATIRFLPGGLIGVGSSLYSLVRSRTSRGKAKGVAHVD